MFHPMDLKVIEYCENYKALLNFCRKIKWHLGRKKKPVSMLKAKHLPSVFSLTFFHVLPTKLETNIKSWLTNIIRKHYPRMICSMIYLHRGVCWNVNAKEKMCSVKQRKTLWNNPLLVGFLLSYFFCHRLPLS